MLKSDWKKIGKRILFFVPLIAGTAGYLTSGEKITDALYAGMTLYGFNSVSSDYNIYIEFARWTAPIAAGAVIVSAFHGLWNTLHWRFRLFGRKDSVAVYSDEDIKIKFDKKTKVIYPGEEFKGYAKSHIILFSSDQESLQFYQKNKEALAGKKVYIGLRELESGLTEDIRNVTLFDVSGSVARLLWKDLALWKMGKNELNVVIYGNHMLAQQILSVGLQQNLYSLKQKVHYYFVSDNPLFQIRHKDIDLMNGDTVTYYETSDDKAWDAISVADRVIIADQTGLDLLQTVAVKAKDGSKIYYYSPKEGDAAEYISFGNTIPFGREARIFTDRNIRQQKLVKSAIALNGYYSGIDYKNEGSEEKQKKLQDKWKKLDGFLKASNISAADYGTVIAKLSKKVSVEELAQLEHMRWCRFYYLNYWKSGDTKDELKRIHRDLIPYGKLDPAEKRKDIKNVQMFCDAGKKSKNNV